MEIRTLKHTDLAVSRACFGTMTFGSQTDEDSAAHHRPLPGSAASISSIRPMSTTRVSRKPSSGQTLKGRRDKVVLASKVRGKMGDGPDESGLSRAAILKAIDESLRRLATDYLDLYYLHQPDYAVSHRRKPRSHGPRWCAPERCAIPASSNYSGWQVCQMQWIAQKNGYQPATRHPADVQPAGARHRAGVPAHVQGVRDLHGGLQSRWPEGC